MPFDLPSLPHILYRLWRLRRLIAVATVLPFFLFALVGLVGLGGPATTTFGLALTLVVLFLVVGAHAVLFPNAWQETLSISLLLMIMAVFLPIFGGSVLAWIVLLICAPFFVMSMQGRILTAFNEKSRERPVFTSRVRVDAPIETVRDIIPLRPGRDIGQYRCGAAGRDGIFPVWYDMPGTDIFDGFCDFDGGQDATLSSSAAGEADPTFFAKIDADAPELQKTLILTPDPTGGWQTEAVVEHRFKQGKAGCLVTETETPDSYPLGQTVSLWMNDFQTDGLVYLRDIIEKRETLALKAAHRWSLLTIAGRWVAGRMMGRVSDG